MNIPEPIVLLGIVLLWLALVALLGRASYRAIQANKGQEGVLLLIATVTIVLFTAQWIVFFVWAIGCEVGLPIGCMK